MRTFVIVITIAAAVLCGCVRQTVDDSGLPPHVGTPLSAQAHSGSDTKNWPIPRPIASPEVPPTRSSPPVVANQEQVNAAMRATLEYLHVCDDPTAAADALRGLYTEPPSEAFLREKLKELQAWMGCSPSAQAQTGAGARIASPPATSQSPPAQTYAVCDPSYWARRIEQTATPGMSDAAKFLAVRNVLELYGCIAPTPPRPAPQFTTCIPLGGGMVSCTTD